MPLFPETDQPDTDVFAGAALLVSAGTGAEILHISGRLEKLSARKALGLLADKPRIICHKAYLLDRLAHVAGASREAVKKAMDQRHLDVCELFAFTVPALSATPTPDGLARALGLGTALSPAETLKAVVGHLFAKLCDVHYRAPREALQTAHFLERGRWPWAKPVIEHLEKGRDLGSLNAFATGLNVWDRLKEFEEDGPRPPGSHDAVEAGEAKKFLGEVLGSDAEQRPSQRAYCADVTEAFKPRSGRHQNHIVLAEAGTGLGKTLGYLVPAFLWASHNKAPVWVSTYTKNLQRQLEQESARLIPDPNERRSKIVTRKGRENYVCLLNMQEAFARMAASNPQSALVAALVARWARFTRDGDMVGGDFPAWLLSLFFPPSTRGGQVTTPMALGLTDRRGECIYAACPHYRKCFIEKSVRAAQKADLVIANHALVLFQAGLDYKPGKQETQNDDDDEGIKRLVFDEGHHLFDAADSAFSAHLTGLEAADLRRWIRGPETQGRRGRSLSDRIGELLDETEEGQNCLQHVISAALALPGPGWRARVQSGIADGEAENFLALVRQQVAARTSERDGMTRETDCRPMVSGLALAAAELSGALTKLKKPLMDLARILDARLAEEAGEIETTDRTRIEALVRSLNRRSRLTLTAWIDMLERLDGEADASFVDWFSIEHHFGQEFDFGLHSHWIDPTVPLSAAVLSQADGVVITSATLKDRPPQAPDDWENAEMRTGAIHLPWPVKRVTHTSPFDYASNARIIVVNDLGRENMDHLAAAYRELFLAAGGGALGLFTAISRLRAVHRRLFQPLASNGLTLFAQHVDPVDTGTLVDMFRAEKDSCLLGTDAVRDGVDVPGNSLRLIVQDRVPWPQPTILERARREAFGGNAWQDMIVRLRLRQAFGRLIRQKDDRGLFVLLDSRLATRFTTAFPPDVEIERMGLADAVSETSKFLGHGHD